MAFLIDVSFGRPGGMVTTIARQPFLIGRDASNDLILSETTVSRVHACLEQRGDGWVVINRSATNPTLVNEVRIKAVAKVAPGDVVGIGNCRLRFVEELPENSRVHRPSDTESVQTIPGGEAVVRQADIAGVVRDPAEVLGMLANGGRSGRVEFVNPVTRDAALVWLVNGDLVAASFRQLAGEEALFAMAQREFSEFYLVNEAAVERNLTKPSAYLLLELARLSDHRRRTPAPGTGSGSRPDRFKTLVLEMPGQRTPKPDGGPPPG